MISPRSERRRARQLSDPGAVALAVVTWVGATSPTARPVGMLVLASAVALAARRPLLLALLCGLLAQGVSQRAADGMHVEVGQRVDGLLTLRSDPRPDDLGQQWRAEVSFAGKRWQLVVPSALADDRFADSLTGERVEVSGVTTTLAWGSDWLRQRHVVGAIHVDRIGDVHDGSALHGVANSLRRHLTDGATSLGPRRQALFVGFVLGDDRFQDPVDEFSFRRAGLTHLLAVSGQNVAFVLALAGPLLGRLRLGGRLALTLGVIAAFALITRFEPSVLRASVMAAIAAMAVTMGRETSSIRVLALTVSLLVLVDPFLVGSVGFRLSVAASAGILLLSGRISRRIPGPRPLALAISVTAAAQLGVAPFLLATFGPVPVASVPANLLAGPAAGPVMTWGMSAGLVAGFVPGLARLLHLPTAALLGWIEWVSREVPSRLPGGLDAHRLLLVVVLGGVVAAAIRRASSFRHVAIAALCVAVLAPVPVRHRPSWDAAPTAGVRVWQGSDGATVVAIDGRARPIRALLALTDLGIDRVDLLVARSDTESVLKNIAAISSARTVIEVVRPTSVHGPVEGRLGCLEIRLEPDPDTVGVAVVHSSDGGCVPPAEIASPDGVGARAPPL